MSERPLSGQVEPSLSTSLNIGPNTGHESGLEPRQTLFLQRQPYRRRRLTDAARVLPVFGAFLFFVPAFLIVRGTPGTTSVMWLFLFGTWIALIVSGALISRVLRGVDTGAGKPRGDTSSGER